MGQCSGLGDLGGEREGLKRAWKTKKVRKEGEFEESKEK